MSGDFEAHWQACLARGARPEHEADARLAEGAASGDAAALRELLALAAPEVEAAARRIDASPQFVDEVKQAVRVRLLVAPAGGRARIAEYGARGPLRAWIAIAATRVALNAKRDGAAPPTTDLLDDLVAAETDAELRHLKSTYRAEFRAALGESLAALPERQRAILRMSYVDGMRAPQLARLYGVHDTTALRWIAAAAEAVAEGARKRLTERLSLSPASVDSLGRMILSQLDLSIARLLR